MISFKKEKDRSGNACVKIVSSDGSFSIRTNESLPYVHNFMLMGKEFQTASLTESFEILEEVSIHVEKYGSERQKLMLA